METEPTDIIRISCRGANLEKPLTEPADVFINGDPRNKGSLSCLYLRLWLNPDRYYQEKYLCLAGYSSLEDMRVAIATKRGIVFEEGESRRAYNKKLRQINVSLQRCPYKNPL